MYYIFIGLTIIEVKTSYYSKEEKKAEKEKEKQVRKIFSLFTDDVDDFVEVKIKEKIKRFLSFNLFNAGRIQEEKEREVKCKEFRESDQSLQVLINQLTNFYPEVSIRYHQKRKQCSFFHGYYLFIFSIV